MLAIDIEKVRADGAERAAGKKAAFLDGFPSLRICLDGLKLSRAVTLRELQCALSELRDLAEHETIKEAVSKVRASGEVILIGDGWHQQSTSEYEDWLDSGKPMDISSLPFAVHTRYLGLTERGFELVDVPSRYLYRDSVELDSVVRPCFSEPNLLHIMKYLRAGNTISQIPDEVRNILKNAA